MRTKAIKLGFYWLAITICLYGVTACSPPKHNAANSAIKKPKSKFPVDRTLCHFNNDSCEKTIDGITFKLMITPKNLPSEKPLLVRLTNSQPIKNITARLEGRDMFMGVIPLNLKATTENTYKGHLIYGSCSSNYMVWRMFVNFTRQGVKQTVLFDFLADNDDQ